MTAFEETVVEKNLSYNEDKVDQKPGTLTKVTHFVLSIVFIAYGITITILRRPSWYVALVVVILAQLRIISNYVSFNAGFRVVWGGVSSMSESVKSSVSLKYRRIVGYLLPAVVILSYVLMKGDSEKGTRIQRLTSLCGMLFLIGLLTLASEHRRKINWDLTVIGVYLQFLVGSLVLGTQAGSAFFSWLAMRASDFLHSSEAGTMFLFKPYAKDTVDFNFVLAVFPGIIFFASFIQMLYYLGTMQWVVNKFSWIMVRLMGVSGAESCVAVASPFVGQGESALLVKPFIKDMTTSEIHTMMVSGFSTIAGGILMALIAQGIDGQSLITSCIMSIPCSLALSKIRIPEVDEPLTKGNSSIPVDKTDREANLLHAAGNGATQGIHLAIIIAAVLLAIVSLMKFADTLLGFFGGLVGIPLSFEMLTQYLFYPFAFILGVPFSDCFKVAQLLGTKMLVNEFVAYSKLTALITAGELSHRGGMVATYALCGFANVSSVGIQVGVLGAMCTNKQGTIARLAVGAMLTGTACTLMSACVAGILM